MMRMQDAPADTVERKALTIHIEFDAYREGAVNDLLRHIQGICTDYIQYAKPLASMPIPDQARSQAQRPY